MPASEGKGTGSIRNEGEGHVIRSFRYERALSVGLRSLHLVGAGAVTGGILLAPRVPIAASFLLWLAVATGIALQADDVYRYGLAYFSTAMFWLIAAKLVCLGLAIHVPSTAAPAIVLSVLMSSAVSHMPGSWRHRRLLGRAAWGRR